MSLDNTEELLTVLRERSRLGRVFARHAYGMLRWVDLLSGRAPDLADPHGKRMVSALVADNARHAILFRRRAAAHGVDPDVYVCPPEGEAIYARMAAIARLDELVDYARGSLEHFLVLLSVYRAAATGEDAEVIDEVRRDVERALAILGEHAGGSPGPLSDHANELYRVRELAETASYAA